MELEVACLNSLIWVYRRHILQDNETFIKIQVDNKIKYNRQYIGNTIESKYKNALLLDFDGFNESIIESILRGNNEYWHKIMKKTAKIPVLIHAHFCEEGLIIHKLAKYLNIPLIVTVHGHEVTLPDEVFVQEYVTKYRADLLKKCDLFIAVSHFIKEKMIAKGFPLEKIKVHYTGIDLSFFSPNFNVIREPFVLFVGRFDVVKGLEYLIDAMCKVQNERPDFELIVIGDGKFRESLELHARKKLKKFRFLGFKNQEVIRDYLNRATVFSAPSIETEDGFTEALGTVFIEASAMGTPTVSFNNGGIKEVIVHNKTGFLAENKNIDELAKYIIELIENEFTWKLFSYNGIERVKKHFNIINQNRILEEIYQMTIEKYI